MPLDFSIFMKWKSLLSFSLCTFKTNLSVHLFVLVFSSVRSCVSIWATEHMLLFSHSRCPPSSSNISFLCQEIHSSSSHQLPFSDLISNPSHLLFTSSCLNPTITPICLIIVLCHPSPSLLMSPPTMQGAVPLIWPSVHLIHLSWLQSEDQEDSHGSVQVTNSFSVLLLNLSNSSACYFSPLVLVWNPTDAWF